MSASRESHHGQRHVLHDRKGGEELIGCHLACTDRRVIHLKRGALGKIRSASWPQLWTARRTSGPSLSRGRPDATAAWAAAIMATAWLGGTAGCTRTCAVSVYAGGTVGALGWRSCKEYSTPSGAQAPNTAGQTLMVPENSLPSAPTGISSPVPWSVMGTTGTFLLAATEKAPCRSMATGIEHGRISTAADRFSGQLLATQDPNPTHSF